LSNIIEGITKDLKAIPKNLKAKAGGMDTKKLVLLNLPYIAARLRENGFKCHVVEISVRDNALHHFTRQHKIDRPTNITSEIAQEAYRIFKTTYQWEKTIRSLGVRGTELTLDHAYEQLDIFCDYTRRKKQKKADAAVDEIRKRFGYFSIQRGLMYQDTLLSSLDAKGSHTVHPQGYFS